MTKWTVKTKNRATGKKKTRIVKTHDELKELLDKINAEHKEIIESMEVDPE